MRQAMIVAGVVLSVESGPEDITEAIKTLAKGTKAQQHHVIEILRALRPLIDEPLAFTDDWGD
jgi:hypothetical protein